MTARVLLVGFDAADPETMRDLAAAGRLPHLARLLAGGRDLTVRNPDGFYVGATWPTLIAGVSAGHHGRWWPGRIRPGSYEVRPTRNEVEPFWSHLARAGRRVGLVDLPFAEVDDTLDVTQVSEWLTHDRFTGFRTSSPSLEAKVTFGAGHTLDECDHYAIDGRRDELEPVLLQGIGAKAELTRDLLAGSDWDLFSVVFGESHCAGHQLWHIHDPDHPLHDPAVAESVGDPLERVYEALDAALGELMATVDDDTTVLVLLSHGMGPHHEGSYLLPEVLRRLEAGWDRSPSPGAVARDRLRRVYLRPARRFGLLPRQTWLVDGSRAFVRAPNAPAATGIRLNLIGREPEGRVAGDEYDDLCRDLEGELLRLVNVETGTSAVQRVLRPAEMYEGQHVDAMPDLLVEWDQSVPIRSLASPAVGRVDGEYLGHRTGDHRRDGLLLVHGPLRATADSQTIDSVDVAPTISELLDAPMPDPEGRPLGLLAAGSPGTV